MNGPVSQADVSETNRARILRHLYAHGVSSRAQIARSLGLTPAAITKIVARLLEAGAVEETGGLEGAGNRRSIGLRLDVSRFHVVGVKFARSLVRVAVFDLAGRLLEEAPMPPVTDATIPETVERVRAVVSRLLAADPRILAVGMGVPGPYLRHVGRTAVVSTMPGWRKVNFLHEFADAFDVPAFVEHDARAGALAHRLFDPGAHDDDLAYYLVGEGVGLGVLDHGRLVNGSMGAATEIGHVSLDVDGPPCDCGNRGCLERYCSASAVHAMADRAGVVPGSASMGHAQACRALFALADDGDPQACALVSAVGRYVGYGAVSIVNAFNPATIVIGDIMAGAGERLLREVRSVVDARVPPEIADGTRIALSSLTVDATLCGAAAVAVERILDHPGEFFDVR